MMYIAVILLAPRKMHLMNNLIRRGIWKRDMAKPVRFKVSCPLSGRRHAQPGGQDFPGHQKAGNGDPQESQDPAF